MGRAATDRISPSNRVWPEGVRSTLQQTRKTYMNGGCAYVKLHHEFGLQFLINIIQMDGKKDSFNTLTGRLSFPIMKTVCVYVCGFG